MRVKLDENLPKSLIEVLASAGHDAETVLDEGLGGAEDDLVFAAARDGDRMLLTLDRGFGDIRRYPPGKHPGIVVLRPLDESRSAVVAAAQRLAAARDLADLAGTICIVEAKRLRIRRATPGSSGGGSTGD